MSSKVLGPADLTGLRTWKPRLIGPGEAEADAAALQAALDEKSISAATGPEALDQARAEGYSLGFSEGRKQASEHDIAERNALKGLMDSLGLLRQELEKDLAGEVLSLSLELAKLMIRQSLALNPEAVLAVLREVMGALPGLSQQTVLHLHPDDAALVKPLLAADPTLAQITWKVSEDSRIERGGCRLETPQSEVDASMATRWSRLVAVLGKEDTWQPEKAK
ncbi:MAG: flagellar assembly protein FliH [Burkholderiales bacterium]